jgi:hypothetical protein
MTPDEIITNLITHGWREFPCRLESKGVRAFAKSFEGHAKCKCNDPKNKQVEIYFHPSESVHGYVFEPRFRVDCIGELPNNQWLRMNVESLKTLQEINEQVRILLAAWDHAVSVTPNIEEPE